MSKQASRIPNPLALNMYLLGYNSRKKLVSVNQAVKENLRTYLGQYRMINEVLTRAIEEVKTFFEVDRWQINQPIVMSDLVYKLSLVDGVSGVVPPKEDNLASNPIIITNKYKTADGYSGNLYDIDSATKNGVIYPSLDPSIFELKFPASDIEGRVVGDY
jgi:hypothetical protein